MPQYRRRFLPGGTYFFTVCLLDRRSDRLVAHVGALRAAVREVAARSPFRVDAWVVLPDHMHCVWTLPEGDAGYPQRWKAIKARFAKALEPVEPRSDSMRRRRERGIWQTRYWEHAIRDADNYAAHVDYTHFNPVKHGLVRAPADWPLSTFPRCVARGMYPPSWSYDGDAALDAGERD